MYLLCIYHVYDSIPICCRLHPAMFSGEKLRPYFSSVPALKFSTMTSLDFSSRFTISCNAWVSLIFDVIYINMFVCIYIYMYIVIRICTYIYIYILLYVYLFYYNCMTIINYLFYCMIMKPLEMLSWFFPEKKNGLLSIAPGPQAWYSSVSQSFCFGSARQSRQPSGPHGSHGTCSGNVSTFRIPPTIHKKNTIVSVSTHGFHMYSMCNPHPVHM